MLLNVLVRVGVLSVVLLATAACGGGGGDKSDAPPVSEPTMTESGVNLSDAVLWLSFDERDRDFDGRLVYRDALNGPYEARVVSNHKGAVIKVPGPEGRGEAVEFPQACEDPEFCPRALLEISDALALDPGLENFEFGATVWLAPDETTTGSNIVQKGRFAASDALWKLQVDNGAGHPSCVIRAGDELVRVRSGKSISDGEWHQVSCRRDADDVTITVDGKSRSAKGTIGSVSSEWPVRIGAPGVGDEDDQFHGRIDDVYLRVGPLDVPAG